MKFTAMMIPVLQASKILQKGIAEQEKGKHSKLDTQGKKNSHKKLDRMIVVLSLFADSINHTISKQRQCNNCDLQQEYLQKLASLRGNISDCKLKKGAVLKT